MESLNHTEYYVARAAASRAMARNAADPQIAKLHEEFARHYDEALIKSAPMPLRMVGGLA